MTGYGNYLRRQTTVDNKGEQIHSRLVVQNNIHDGNFRAFFFQKNFGFRSRLRREDFRYAQLFGGNQATNGCNDVFFIVHNQQFQISFPPSALSAHTILTRSRGRYALTDVPPKLFASITNLHLEPKRSKKRAKTFDRPMCAP